MIAIPDNLTAYVPPASGMKKANGAILGKDDFLKLLVTQLRYQDPESPVDNKDLTAQLAQFSSLEQMQQISQGFNSLKSILEEQGKFSLLGAVGMTATAPGNAILSDANGYYGLFDLKGTSSATSVTIADVSGKVVRTLDLGRLPAGENRFSWDGMTSGGGAAPAGTYRFSVNAVGESGAPVYSTPYVEGTVTGVSLGETPVAYIGDIPVPFSTIDKWKGGVKP